MKDWKNCCLSEDSTIMDAVRVIDKSGKQIALIIDDNDILKGILTDGDIRRAVLKGVDFNNNISVVMNRNPVVAKIDQSNDEICEIMRNRIIHQIPVIDSDRHVVNLVSFTDLIGSRRHDNIIFLMVGGLGTRLMPLTKEKPKPLLNVGTKPILEIIIESFAERGFYKFYLSVNYKAEMIEKYFGDGSKWNVEINYIKEKKKMGTAGSLSLLPEKLSAPIIVMNGDILTKVNFSSLIEYHINENAAATMAVREYTSCVPYGVIETKDNKIVSIKEKPIEKRLVNAGIYVLNPEVLEMIEKNKYLDMPGLYQKLLERNQNVVAFPITEYWIDIGHLDDYEKAQLDYYSLWEE